MVNKVVT